MEDPAMLYDVLIVGGGPAGLAAALALGRARRRVLLCDAGERRNAAAEHMHNFVTRDGTPPSEFRAIARAQLKPYESVSVRDTRVLAISGRRGAFQVQLEGANVQARRVLLCTGMVDQMEALAGYRELWGKSIFQCPYCHGWEVQNRKMGYLARAPERLGFAIFLRGWTRDVTLFTEGRVAIEPAVRARLEAAHVTIEERPIQRLITQGETLSGVELALGQVVPCEVLFAHPAQRQVELVRSLGLKLNEAGYVAVDELHRETSVPGIYAGGDLTTPIQGAALAAAAGTLAAAMLNHELIEELAISGALQP